VFSRFGLYVPLEKFGDARELIRNRISKKDRY